jgi:hypothetical protein
MLFAAVDETSASVEALIHAKADVNEPDDKVRFRLGALRLSNL